MPETVEHQQHRHRFVVRAEGHEAELTYLPRGPVMVIDHTGVPEAIQHRGLADLLAEAALDYAATHDRKVDPQCRFMQVYLQRHPQYDHLLAGAASAEYPPGPMAGRTR